MRGDLVSRPIGEVLAEAKRLADAGVKELLVISQTPPPTASMSSTVPVSTTACR
jgi:hypothetical protein